MNLSLSKGDLPAFVKNRTWQYCQMAWRGMTNKKTLSHLVALPPLLLLSVGRMTNTIDLLARGKGDVEATFSTDSFVMMCTIVAELIVGVAMCIRTRNLLILLGLVVVIVFTTVGLTFINRYGGKWFRQTPLPENPVRAEPHYWIVP